MEVDRRFAYDRCEVHGCTPATRRSCLGLHRTFGHFAIAAVGVERSKNRGQANARQYSSCCCGFTSSWWCRLASFRYFCSDVSCYASGRHRFGIPVPKADLLFPHRMLRCVGPRSTGVVVGRVPGSTLDLCVVSSLGFNVETIFPVVDGRRRNHGRPAGLVLECAGLQYLKSLQTWPGLQTHGDIRA